MIKDCLDYCNILSNVKKQTKNQNAHLLNGLDVHKNVSILSLFSSPTLSGDYKKNAPSVFPSPNLSGNDGIMLYVSLSQE